jgi:hypothetical protein
MENREIHLNYNFFILFPGGYRVRDVLNDNTDIYIVLKNNHSKVYFATLFTLDNVKFIMEVNDEKWFWSSNFLVVKNLLKNEIYKIIDEIVNSDSLDMENIFSKLDKTYSEIVETNEIRDDLL